MARDTLADSPVWEEFQKEARAHRRNPVSLLTEYMRERLEIWEDQKLDEEIRADLQKNGYRERDAVEVVRRYRREKAQGAR